MANGLKIGNETLGLGLADLLRGTSSSAPNILQRLGAVLQGQKDPNIAFENQRLTRAVTVAQLMQREKQSQLQKEEADRNQFNDLLNFMAKTDVDEETATKVIRSYVQANPNLSKIPELQTLTISPKTKEFKSTRLWNEGELIDPTTKQALPGGMYETVQEIRGGKISLKAYKPVEPKESVGTITPAKIQTIITLKRHGALTESGELNLTRDNMAAVEADLEAIGQRESGAYLNRIFQAQVNKRQGKATPRDEAVLGAVSEFTKTAAGIAGTQAEAKGTGALLGRKVVELRQQRADYRRVIEGLGSVQDKIQANPAILAAPGTLSRTITSLTDQANAFATLIIPGADYQALKNITDYANIFRETGIASTELQSQLLGLAIAVASAEGFTNRAVTRDRVQLNLQRLAGAVGGGSAETAFDTLEQFKQEMARGYQTQVEGVLGREELTAPILKPEDRRTFGAKKLTEPRGAPPRGSISPPPGFTEKVR